jgi:hypothetical protein
LLDLQETLNRGREEISNVVCMMQTVGESLDVDLSFIGGEVSSENLLAYMGLIEQAVGELVAKKHPQKIPAS